MTNTTDPHVKWLEEWRAEIAKLEAAADETPEEKRHAARAFELSKLLANTPATTGAGLAAQLAWFQEDLGDYVTQMVGDDLKGCIDTLIAGALKTAQLSPDQTPAS